MDLTNARSMELLQKIGLADGLRNLGQFKFPYRVVILACISSSEFNKGVPRNVPYTVLMSTGLSQSSAFTQWDHPSVDEYREHIMAKNDGTQPLEPYQRVSQQIFETWMRDLCEQNPLTELRYEHKLESIAETNNGVEAQVTTARDGLSWNYHANYMVACDGASSRSRKSLDIGLEGGPM